MLKMELRRAFNKKWIFALACCILSGLSGIIGYYMDASFTDMAYANCFEAWIYCLSVSESSIYTILFPVFISFPFISTFYSERHSSYIYFISIREGYGKYLAIKILIAMLSAISMIMLSMAMWFFWAKMYFPENILSTNTCLYQVQGAFSAIYMKAPLIYMLIIMLINLITAACFVLLTFFCSFFVKTKARAILMPFFIYLGLIVISQFMGRVYNPIVLLSPLEWEKSSISQIFLYWLAIAVISGCGIYYSYLRDRKELIV